MIKILTLSGAVAGALALSQFPAFSQSYLQRLAGQVDALSVVAMDFDRSALASGLGREEALQQMIGTEFLEARQVDMRRTFARHARLVDDLTALRQAGPIEALVMPQRFMDRATVEATLADFKPGISLGLTGFIAAGVGAVFGWAAVSLVLSLLAWPFRRKPRAVERREPVLTTPERGRLFAE